VVVGHSLGSVIGYEALCASADRSVRALVTLGSPLGIRRLIFDRLRPSPVNGRGVWPGQVVNWTNIADQGDVVALVKSIGPLFNRHVVDLLVDNGAKAHDLRPYLTARETGRAIGAGLAG
jgi:pimeloyl-ACP methyl ester carboxylesterase